MASSSSRDERAAARIARPEGASPRRWPGGALAGAAMVMSAPARSVDVDLDARIVDAVVRSMTRSMGVERDAVGVRSAGRTWRPASWRILHSLLELGVRHGLVDEAPLDGAVALHAFLHRAEGVGAVAAHLALVGDAGQAAGAGQHGQQRQLGQRHRRVAVVGEHDVVGRQRQLVAATGRGAAHGADDTSGRSASLASSMPLRVSLVNLQKLTLWA